MYGATSDSMIATASAASRTAGSAAPGPLSTALRVALTSSMTRATTTLKRCASSSAATSWTVLWVARRSATSPPSAGVPAGDATSPLSRHTRCRKRSEPAGDMSAQSMSSSGGPAKTRVSRTASTPKADNWSPRLTPLPSDLLIFLPWLMTMPWFSCAENGSRKSTRPMSFRTMVKNRAYSRCSTACSTPPT